MVTCAAIALTVLGIVDCVGSGQDEAVPAVTEPQATEEPREVAGYSLVADLPEYLSGEGVSWIERWPWIQVAGLCGEEVTSDLESLPMPGHGLTSESGPSDELRRAAAYLGLEWDDWEGRWFDRNSVTLYRRTVWIDSGREYAGASLYLMYHGDPPRWDEAQSSLLYRCPEGGGDNVGRPLPRSIYVDLDGEQVDVRYGAVLSLLNPTHLPGIDLEQSCSWVSPGFVDHGYGRYTAEPHGLSEGSVTVSELPASLLAEAVRYGHEMSLDKFEHLWVTEFRVMAFTRSARERSNGPRLAEVREFGLITEDGEERWVELASGVIWDCSNSGGAPSATES